MPCHRKWCGVCKKAINKRQNIIADFLTCIEQEMKPILCLLTKYKHTADMKEVG